MARRSEQAQTLAGGSDEEREFLARFGSRVRQLRQERKLSQEDFALSCGLGRTYISGVERGHRNVSLLNLRLMAKVLELAPAALLDTVS
jgi:transcriptional regulator with XRE-family HTH domain